MESIIAAVSSATDPRLGREDYFEFEVPKSGIFTTRPLENLLELGAFAVARGGKKLRTFTKPFESALTLSSGVVATGKKLGTSTTMPLETAVAFIAAPWGVKIKGAKGNLARVAIPGSGFCTSC
jgi:hypothetical protein